MQNVTSNGLERHGNEVGWGLDSGFLTSKIFGYYA